MLANTFLHLPGVGSETEQRLWKAGVLSWRALMRSRHPYAAAVRRRRGVEEALEASAKALGARDIGFFAERLPRQEWWRLYRDFQSNVLFLDLETTGLSHYYDEITVIGSWGRHGFRALFAGHNLHDVAEILSQYEIVVTFNGTLFDLRFLTEKFGPLPMPSIHLDLRYLLARIGYRGGLKQIERALQIKRVGAAAGIDGLMATVLWSRFIRGEIDALERLLAYNIADITVLRSLADFSCRSLAARAFGRRYKGSPSRPRLISVAVSEQGPAAIKVRLAGTDTVVPIVKLRPLVTMADLISRLPNPQKLPRVVGIDLTGSSKRLSGWATVVGTSVETKLLASDDELISETVRAEPDVVSIDAPLAFPRGRCCALDSCHCRRPAGITRECERVLWKRGVRVYPCLLPSMQGLTQRGIRLAAELRKIGLTVIESYPGAAQDIMRIPRKGTSLTDLRDGLVAFGLGGPFLETAPSHDELDAVTSALVAYFYLTGDAEELGPPDEGPLIVPRLRRT